MKYIIIIVWCAFNTKLFSQQNIESILAEIEKNNPALTAIRKNVDAEKIGVKTGIYLQNPDVEFSYLWGNPSVLGNRTDFNIKQSFDFPSVYIYKNQISNLRKNQTELEYLRQRNAVFLQVRRLCADLIYVNAMKKELRKRSEHADRLAKSYRLKYETGEINILEFNKAQINYLRISKDLESIQLDGNELLSELAGLNGGVYVDFNDSSMTIPAIEPDFQKWYEMAEKISPILQWYNQEIAISKKQEDLNAALRLPKLQVGYMREKVIGQTYQGITFGLTVPLWEQKNATKYARLKTIALSSAEADTKARIYNRLKTLHAKAIYLQTMALDYRKQLLTFDNYALLQKAHDKGELSLSEYILEISFSYESTDKLLEMEKNLNRAVAELYGHE